MLASSLTFIQPSSFRSSAALALPNTHCVLNNSVVILSSSERYCHSSIFAQPTYGRLPTSTSPHSSCNSRRAAVSKLSSVGSAKPPGKRHWLLVGFLPSSTRVLLSFSTAISTVG